VLPLLGSGVAEFDSAVRVVPFPLHKARKPAELTAEHGSSAAIIRTLTAAGMEPVAAKMIVEAEPLPTFCGACGFIHSHCTCFENDGA
jgi:hypothetical protein